MSEIGFGAFSRLAETHADANLFVDLKSGELKVRNNHFLNRIVQWVRDRTARGSPNARAEREAAYNRFIRAMNDSPYYDAAEKNRTRLELHAQGISAGKPLNTRRIRQILAELDTPGERRNPGIYHQNRVVANAVAGRLGSNRLERALAGTSAAPEQREQLSKRIFDAVLAAGGPRPDDPVREVTQSEGLAIADRLIEEFLDATKPVPAQAPPERAPVEERGAGTEVEAPVQDRAEAETEADPSTVRRESPRPLQRRSTVGPEPPEPLAVAREGGVAADPSRLLRQLQKADLPGEVRERVHQRVVDGGVAGTDELGRSVNDQTAAWVSENRVARWYREGLKNTGLPVPSDAKVPAGLKGAIEDSIRNHDGLFPYTAVKGHTRALVGQFISAQRMFGQHLKSLNAPEEVRKEMQTLVASGQVRSMNELIERTNAGTASWIERHRIGKWYEEGLRKSGLPYPKEGIVPQDLVDRIVDSVAGRGELYDYEDVKRFARREVAAYLKGTRPA